MYGINFSNHDDYYTPKSVWEDINKFIPQNKIIWEPFYGDGKSGENLRELGHTVIHEPKDFFKWQPDNYDIIISNPPFSKKKEVFKKLKELNKPFIMISPSPMICYKYFRELFSNDNQLKIIIPKRRIQFIKFEKGKYTKEGRCNFDCFYYCYKIDLQQQINYIT